MNGINNQGRELVTRAKLEEPQPELLTPPTLEPVIRIGIIVEEDQRTEIRFICSAESKVLVKGLEVATLLSGTEYLAAYSFDGVVLRSNDGQGVVIGETLTVSCPATVQIRDVTAGRGFHWEKLIDQQLPGLIEFVSVDRKLVLVNIIKTEQYVASVVASEMSGADSPPALCCAQAVAARSWAYVFLRNKYPNRPYELCNDDMSQRYQGVTYLQQSVLEAVSKSAGQYLVGPEGKVCACYYSKSCGGHSEDPVRVFGFPVGGHSANWDCPSKPVVDLTSEAGFKQWLNCELEQSSECYCSPTTVPEDKLQRYLGAVDVGGQYFRWRHTTEVSVALAKLYDHCGISAVAMRNLIAGPRGHSGRLFSMCLELKLADGSQISFQLEDQYYLRKILHESFLYSSACIWEVERDVYDNILAIHFEGAGWGHGVGMCQIGALGMSLQGYDYEQILSHYFPGTRLVQAY